MNVNDLIKDPKTSAADIANLISTDIALSTKILKLVNSPFYGFSKQITGINYAIVILGFNAVRNLAMTAFIMDLGTHNVGDFDTKAYWEFSINNAVVCEFLATAGAIKDRDNAFIAGLVHDIGVIIMHQFFEDEFALIFPYAKENNCTLLEAERKLLSFTHLELGYAILDSWNLPQGILDICKNYSSPAQTQNELTAVVHISDIICRALCLGNPGDNSISMLDEGALALLSLKSSDLHPLLTQVIAKTSSTSSLLK